MRFAEMSREQLKMAGRMRRAGRERSNGQERSEAWIHVPGDVSPTGWSFEKGRGQTEFLKNYEKVDTLQLLYPERLGGGMREIELWEPR